VGGTLPKAVLLLLCFFSLELVACSTEPPGEQDRAERPNAPRGTLAGGAGDLTVSDESPRQPTIEGARLQTGVEGEKIIVVVGQGGFFPDCFLMDERAVRGTGREGVYSRRAKSRWPKEDATETAQMGESYIAVFHEDPHPNARVADPRKTPYSVLCVEAITMRAVKAHVEGTPRERRLGLIPDPGKQ
jgi:hypothetical protein